MRLVFRSAYITTALTMLLLQPGAAYAGDDPRYVRAFGKLYTTARLGGLVKERCDARAPATREATEAALAVWKITHRLDDIEARAASVLGDQLPSVVAAVEARRESVFRALDKDSKSPDADCRQMLGYLNRSADPKRVNPAEFRLVMSQRDRAAAAPVASAAGAPVTLPVPTPPVATPAPSPSLDDAPPLRGSGSWNRSRCRARSNATTNRVPTRRSG